MVFNHNQKFAKGNVPRGGRREPGRGADGVTVASGDQAGHLADVTSQALSRWPWGAGKREGQCEEEHPGPPGGLSPGSTCNLQCDLFHPAFPPVK